MNRVGLRSSTGAVAEFDVAGVKSLLGPLALVSALSCCCDSTGPERELLLEIVAGGRLERGAVVQARASFEGTPVPDSLVEWTADPSDAAEFLPGSRVKFLRAASVDISAEAEVEPGRIARGQLALEIALPPLLVFDLERDGNRDIYSARLDGGDLLRLTQAGNDDIDPTAAAGIVVFTSFRDGNAELYSVPLAGGVPQRLTNTVHSEIQAALSADGGRLAYTANPSGIFKVWTSQADGSGAAEATTGFGFFGSVEASPSWDPTDDRLVFVSTANGSADLFELVLGGTPTALVAGPHADVEPAWSPDGASIVFATNRTGDTELFAVRVASGDLTQLTRSPGADGEPAWLPDGRIVYTSYANGSPTLRWLDPADPDSVFEIPIGPGEPRRASGVF